MSPITVPNRPSNGANCAMVASKFSFSSSRGTSISPASSNDSRTRSRPLSRFKIAVFTRRATGPGVASQMEIASTTLSRRSTLRTPLRNSVELICARWQWKKRSMKTTMATAPASRINKKTGPPLFRINGKVMRSLYDLTLQVQRAKLGSGLRVPHFAPRETSPQASPAVTQHEIRNPLDVWTCFYCRLFDSFVHGKTRAGPRIVSNAESPRRTFRHEDTSNMTEDRKSPHVDIRWLKDIERVLITEQQLARRISEM